MYEVIQHGQTVPPRKDIELDDSISVAPDEGVWVTRSGNIATGEASNGGSAAFPNWTSGNRTDVQALDFQITVLYPTHWAETDKYVSTDSNGNSVTYQEGEDLSLSTAQPGHLIPASNGDAGGAVVASTTVPPSQNDGKLELLVT